MEKVRVGVVGAGFFGENHARVYSESLLADLVAVADVNLDRAEEIAQRYNAGSRYSSV